MAPRLLAMLLLAATAASCSASQQDTQTPEAHSLKKDAPYCADGKRDNACLFGKNCFLTGDGCKVCQCEGLED
jgi:hypothetical protein